MTERGALRSKARPQGRLDGEGSMGAGKAGPCQKFHLDAQGCGGYNKDRPCGGAYKTFVLVREKALGPLPLAGWRGSGPFLCRSGPVGRHKKPCRWCGRAREAGLRYARKKLYADGKQEGGHTGDPDGGAVLAGWQDGVDDGDQETDRTDGGEVQREY